MSKSNKQAKKMIISCITNNYGHEVAEWRQGRLMQKNWNKPFSQGLFHWFGSIKDIS